MRAERRTAHTGDRAGGSARGTAHRNAPTTRTGYQLAAARRHATACCSRSRPRSAPLAATPDPVGALRNRHPRRLAARYQPASAPVRS